VPGDLLHIKLHVSKEVVQKKKDRKDKFSHQHRARDKYPDAKDGTVVKDSHGSMNSLGVSPTHPKDRMGLSSNVCDRNMNDWRAGIDTATKEWAIGWELKDTHLRHEIPTCAYYETRHNTIRVLHRLGGEVHPN